MPRWTPEARARQREAIARWKPWKLSTGPKTKQGKARSAQNSLKHGMRSREMRELESMLAETSREISQLFQNFD